MPNYNGPKPQGFSYSISPALALTAHKVKAKGNKIRPHFMSSEHLYIGNDISLAFPDPDGKVSKAAGVELHIIDAMGDYSPSHMPITYGEAIALCGDFYGVPEQPISTAQDGAEAFKNAFNTFQEGLKKQVDGTCEAQKILDIMKREIEAVAEKIKQHLPPSQAYEELGEQLSSQWNVVTGGSPDMILSSGRYLSLAKNNWDHFGEHAIVAYKVAHRYALEFAAGIKAKTTDFKVHAKYLEYAYLLNAFADHFLTDLFSSGHLRTPRKDLHDEVSPAACGDLLSKFMHDEDNKIGLKVKNARGDKWTAYGDGKLMDTDDPENKNLAMAEIAVEFSVADIYYAYDSEKVPTGDYQALRIIPDIMALRNDAQRTNHSPMFIIKNGKTARRVNLNDIHNYNWDWYIGIETLIELEGTTSTGSWKSLAGMALSAAVYAFGFNYDPTQDIIYSRKDAFQRGLGFCYAYDKFAILMSAAIDCEPIFFEYNNKTWMIELWKGQYGLETGGEIGIYNRDYNPNLGYSILDDFSGTRDGDSSPRHNKFFLCANESEELVMSFVLLHKGKIVFSRGPEKHWWLTGFKWGIYAEAEDLEMQVNIHFDKSQESMKGAFTKALEDMAYQYKENTDNTGNYYPPGTCIVSFTFNKPKTYQPRLSDPLLPGVKLNNQAIVAFYQQLKLPNNDPNKIPGDVIDQILGSVGRFKSLLQEIQNSIISDFDKWIEYLGILLGFDFNTYVQIVNMSKFSTIEIVGSDVSFGYFEVSPPELIPPGCTGRFIIHGNISGSAGYVDYKIVDSKSRVLKKGISLSVGCPTGTVGNYVNISGNADQADNVHYHTTVKIDGRDKNASNDVEKSGRPLIVRFAIEPFFASVFLECDPGKGIGIGKDNYDLSNKEDRAFALDFNSSGKLDHIFLYRPKTGKISVFKNENGDLKCVFKKENGGISIDRPGNLINQEDQALAFDYIGSGKLDHILIYNLKTGENSVFKQKEIISGQLIDIKKVATLSNIAKDSYNYAFAFDCNSIGHSDHIVFYKSEAGNIAIMQFIKGASGVVSCIYMFTSTTGIGGYDLKSKNDRAFAFDYESSGKSDHIVLFRPDQGAISIMKKTYINGQIGFEVVYKEGDPGDLIPGFRLHNENWKACAYDYLGSGKLDHIVFYLPGSKALAIIGFYPDSKGKRQPKLVFSTNRQKYVSYLDGQGAQADLDVLDGPAHRGVGGYDLASIDDLAFAFDYEGSGQKNHLVIYRPGKGAIGIVKPA